MSAPRPVRRSWRWSRVSTLAVLAASAIGTASASSASSAIEAPASATRPAVRVALASAGVSDVRDAGKFSIDCESNEAEVAAAGGPRVDVGAATIYAGTQQVTGINKDPRLIRFDDGSQTWCRTDIETTPDDGQAYGLVWDGQDRLYAAFSATGTQGTPDQDLRRVARGGWLRTYSDASSGGGGAKVAVLARIDPATGEPIAATFITARRSGGRVNSFDITSLRLNGSGVEVDGTSFFSPRRVDRTTMTCAGQSPFTISYEFVADLSAVTSARAPRCS